jgi:hypothetical protein
MTRGSEKSTETQFINLSYHMLTGRYVTTVYIQKPHPFGIDRKENTELIAR